MTPFRNRTEAGEGLAERLVNAEFRADPVVLALPRGGVPVAKPLADRLGAPLDVLVVRKLGVPSQPELAMGAICHDVRILDEALIRSLGITPEELEEVTARERAEMQRRTDAYRPPGAPRPSLTGKTAIVVDDGIATGSTMAAACRALRAHNPAEVVVAVPVASRQAVRMLEPEVDQLIAIEVPSYFGAVGNHYVDFRQTTDEEVRALLH